MTAGGAADRATKRERVVAPAVPLRVLPARGNLPAALTSFVGRERELAEAERLLGATRLLTLTGAGGCGKTRLALAVAAELDELAQFEDGVWWVGLAGLQDGALLPQSVITALRLPEDPGRDGTEHLGRLLGPRELLLVLDNCEHLLPACRTLVGPLLSSCPDLTVLCTSRSALALPGETVWSVAPMRLPPASARPDPEALADSEAGRLFLARATSALPSFTLTPGDAPAVADLCRRLDGIPLALELAAAWVRILSPHQIAERLDDCFRLLSRGRVGDLAHHQTMRAAVDWSYDLLDEPERALFRRLAVFRGGLSLAAAEAVAAGPEPVADDLLVALAGLVEKSMLQAQPAAGEDPRYRLLEPLRQYAAERLEEAGEGEAVRQRHLAYFAALTEEAEPELTGPAQGSWLDRLDREHENLRAAMAWGLAGGDAEAALRVAASARWFWLRRSHTVEGLGWCERTLERNAGAPPALRAKALNAAGTLAWRQSRYPLARHYFEQAVALMRDIGDERGVGLVAGNLGIVATEQSDYVAGQRYFQDSLAASETFGDLRGQANGHLNLGSISLNRGQLDVAREHYERSLDLFRDLADDWGVAALWNNLALVDMEHGDWEAARVPLDRALSLRRALAEPWGIADTLCNIGTTRMELGRLDEARLALEESRGIWEQLDNPRGMAFTLEALGCLARVEGRLEDARAHLTRALTIWRDTGDPRNAAILLDEFGHLALACGQDAEAVRHFAASDALLGRVGASLPPYRVARRDRVLAASRLSSPALDAARAEGAALTLDAAVARATGSTPPGLASPAAESTSAEPLSRREARERFGGLTAREREVSVLLVQGLTNHEIAAELIVVVKTVEKHISNILLKLGFDNRVQVSAWAVARGLAEAPVDLDAITEG